MAYEPVGLSFMDITAGLAKLPAMLETAGSAALKLLPGMGTKADAGLPADYVVDQTKVPIPQDPSKTDWTKWALYGGLAVGAFFLIKSLKKGRR